MRTAESRANTGIDRTRSRISYNAAVRFGGRTAGGLVSLAALHLAAHYFEPVHWGPIVAALALVGLFSSLADFGVSSVLARDLVTNDDPGLLFGSGLVTALGVSLVATALATLVAAVAFSSLPTSQEIAFLLLPTVPATALFSAASSVFISRSRNDMRALCDVLSSVLPFAGVVAIVSLRAGSDSYAILLASVSVVMALVGLALAARYLRPRLSGGRRRVKTLLGQAWPLGASQLSAAIYVQIDVLLVAAFLSGTQVGWYGLASQVATFFASVPAMLTVAATPAFVKKSEPERRQLAHRLFQALAAAGVGTLCIGIFLPRLILEIVGGNRYLPAAGGLRLLLCAAAISFLVSTFGAVVYLSGNQRYLWRIAAAVLVANVVANLVAIPLWGIDGAAGALVLSELVALGYSSATARRIGYKPWRRSQTRSIGN